MSPLAQTEPKDIATGVGWRADIYQTHILLRVAPDGEDVGAAVKALVAPKQLRFWTLEHVYEDEFGWDVYVFERDNS